MSSARSDEAVTATAHLSLEQARSGLVELVEKYRLLERLRRDEPGRTRSRRDAMRAVAARFPAALREWDELPLDEVVRRRELCERLCEVAAGGDEQVVRAALAEAGHAFVRYGLALHGRLREALAVKRFLGGLSSLGSSERAARLAAAALRFGRTRAELEAIAEPPRGRLTELVYAEAARAEGVPVECFKATLFGTDAPSPS